MGGIEGFLAERGGVLLRAARVLTGDDGHAEDLLQTALAKSLGAYATLSSEHKFEAYLRTTVLNLCRDHGRRSATVRSQPSPVLEVAPGEHEVVEAIVRDKMGHAMPLDVPLDVSVGTGVSWHDAAH